MQHVLSLASLAFKECRAWFLQLGFVFWKCPIPCFFFHVLGWQQPSAPISLSSFALAPLYVSLVLPGSRLALFIQLLPREPHPLSWAARTGCFAAAGKRFPRNYSMRAVHGCLLAPPPPPPPAPPRVTDRVLTQDTKAARETNALQAFYAMLAADPARAFYGPGHVRAAAELGAVATLLLSDSLLRVNDIQQARWERPSKMFFWGILGRVADHCLGRVLSN